MNALELQRTELNPPQTPIAIYKKPINKMFLTISIEEGLISEN